MVSAQPVRRRTTESAFKVSENLLAAHKGPGGLTVQGIFCPNESTAFGMLRALEDAASPARSASSASTARPSWSTRMAKGHMDATVVQDPFKMGYLGVKAMVEHLQGKQVDKRIDTGATLIARDDHDLARGAGAAQPDFKRWLKE